MTYTSSFKGCSGVSQVRDMGVGVRGVGGMLYAGRLTLSDDFHSSSFFPYLSHFFHQRESEFLSNRGRQGLSSILFICNG